MGDTDRFLPTAVSLRALVGCLLVVVLPTWAGAQASRETLPPNADSAAGGAGGAAMADFDSLIDLIQSTVSMDTWLDAGTGDGTIEPFPNGVFVDAAGKLQVRASSQRFAAAKLAPTDRPTTPVQESSERRYVSLTRLETAIAKRQVAGEPLSEEMLTLAGLERVDYLYAAPESGEIIIAGPASDWRIIPPGHTINLRTGQPSLRLDVLLELWRRHLQWGAVPFGVSIVPRQQALAEVQAYLDRTADISIDARQRRSWLRKLRDTLGEQDVEFFGLEPQGQVAFTLLAADYHMKLIGMGLVPAVEGVTNYLDSVEVGADGSVPPLTVLRWWFAMDDETVDASPEGDAYKLPKIGVRLLSENQLLAEQGKRIHTHESEELNRQFAASFTREYAAISDKYPLYGELRNVFELALVVALIHENGLVEQVSWQPTHFLNADALRLPTATVPTEVDTVVNHRVIHGRHIVAGISGGVSVNAAGSLKTQKSQNCFRSSPPKPDAKVDVSEVWWWD